RTTTPSGVLMLAGWITGTPASSAMALIPRPTCRVLPRRAPTSRSGCVTTPTTSPGRLSSASSVGSANVPVPIITTRMQVSLGGTNHRVTEEETPRKAKGIYHEGRKQGRQEQYIKSISDVTNLLILIQVFAFFLSSLLPDFLRWFSLCVLSL